MATFDDGFLQFDFGGLYAQVGAFLLVARFCDLRRALADRLRGLLLKPDAALVPATATAADWRQIPLPAAGATWLALATAA